jgi:hypothetical protein
MGGARNQRFRLANASLRLHKRRHAPQAFQTAINPQKICLKILKESRPCRPPIAKKIPFSERPGDVIGRWWA